MRKSQELQEPNSCLNKARGDEPIFVLRAKDPIAAKVVTVWAMLARGVHEEEKCEQALQDAREMEEWHKENILDTLFKDEL